MARLIRIHHGLHARYMLASLVALQLVAPLVTSERSWVSPGLASGALLVAYLGVMLAAIFTLGPTRRMAWIGAVLVSPPLVLGLLVLLGIGGINNLAVGAAASPVLMVVAKILFGHIMHAKTSTASRLYASGAVYLVLAHTWASLYAIVEMVHPGSFAETYAATGAQVSWSDLLYYSLVTITTLGYGDITPVDQFARALASLEAVTGVFFMAVVVARLVAASDIRSVSDSNAD